MIECAYTLAEAMGIVVWCEDEAGPYGTVPYDGMSWQAEGQPAQIPHEYIRAGTAKMLTLFHLVWHRRQWRCSHQLTH